MGYSRLEYPYTGGDQEFPASFALGYLNKEDVTVWVRGELDGLGDQVYRAFTWVGDTHVSVTDPIAIDAIVVVDRTVLKDQLTLDVTGSAAFTRETLVNGFKQVVMNVHELMDGRIPGYTDQLEGALTSLADAQEDISLAHQRALDAEASATAAALSETASGEILADTTAAVDQLGLHPLAGGSLVRAYDPGTLTAHPGGLMYNPVSNRLWRVYTEGVSHLAVDGMSVVTEYSDDAGATWKGKRTLFPGESTRKVQAIACRHVNGRLLVIVNSEAAGIVRYLDMIYSDDAGATWSIQAITKPGGVEPFLFDAVHARNTAAGGDDLNGAVFYCYNNGSVYAFHTNDKGATWANAVVMSGASSYLDVNGLPATGLVATEVAVGQVGTNAEYVFYIRCANYANMICGTSTDMLTITGLRDSGVANEGPSLAVGTPPHFIAKDTDLTLYTFGRENWMAHDVAHEQALMFYKQDAASLYAAGGLFTNKTPRVAAQLPTRAIGMMSHVTTPSGIISMFRAGETVYANFADAVTSQIYQMTSYPLPSNPILARPNLADNSDFSLWSQGISFPGVVLDDIPTADRWQLYASAAGGGDTMTVTREVLATAIARNLPHRPRYGLRLTSTGAAYSGLQQVHRGEAELARFADTEITISVIGVGILPSTCQVSVIFDCGGGGTTIDPISVNLVRGRETATGVSIATATVRCPSIVGATLGTDPKVIIRVAQVSASAWNYLFAGFKVETGNGATVLSGVDADAEQAKGLKYYLPLSDIHTVHRRSTTLSVAAIQHPPMAKLPTLVVVNPAGYTIEHLAGSRVLSGASLDRQSVGGCRLKFDHAADTSFTSGVTYRSGSPASLALSAE